MSLASNTLQTNILGHEMSQVPKKILTAIEKASDKSGVDFSYLVKQAKAESSFDPNAKAKTSSATGLYQFIDSTWIDMVNKYGDDYGMNTAGKSRSEILAMRKDPESASFMAAAFASENEKSLDNNWGGDVGATELYFAHFLGASGAAAFLNARDENPIRSAADIFPRAARANRNVFYDRETGQPRSLEAVYQFFNQKFAPDGAENTQQNSLIASAVPTPPPVPQKKAQAHTNTIQESSYANNIIAQRSREMREAAANHGRYGQLNTLDLLNAPSVNTFTQRSTLAQTSKTHAKTPFFTLLAQPVDLMLLTQTTTPSKVISDKS